MLLKEILQIKPGTLIKGFKVEPRQITFNIDGWKQYEYGDPSIWDNEFFPKVTTIYRDDNVQKIIREHRASFSTPKNLSLQHMHENLRGISFFTLTNKCFIFGAFKRNEVVGLSLGENIVARIVGRGIYNLELEEIVCFHRILSQKEIIWVRLSGLVRLNYYDEQETIQNCLNCPMWIEL